MAITATPEEQLAEIKRGTADIVSEEELLAKFKKSVETGTPLNIKFGADPSRPDIHLGHTVVLTKLRQFQDLGHHIQFIIGDFTARIGDPTGRSKTRPQLTEDEVTENARTYREQLFKILDPELTEVVYNADWLGKLSPMDFIRLLGSHTMQQLLARDDFTKRYNEQTPIYLHEFVYPLVQAYDSVHLKADVEVGGTDQTFNLMRGRELQRSVGQRPQSLVIMPILEGTDGVQKMSKSYDNYISLADTPKDMYGKVMSIPDELMPRYYTLLSDRSVEDVETLIASWRSGETHPMRMKKDLAHEITARFTSVDDADRERDNFEKMFSKNETPEDLPVHTATPDENGEIFLPALAKELGFVSSNSDARRLIKGRGMKIDNEAVESDRLPVSPGDEFVFRCGKKNIITLRIEG